MSFICNKLEQKAIENYNLKTFNLLDSTKTDSIFFHAVIKVKRWSGRRKEVRKERGRSALSERGRESLSKGLFLIGECQRTLTPSSR